MRSAAIAVAMAAAMVGCTATPEPPEEPPRVVASLDVALPAADGWGGLVNSLSRATGVATARVDRVVGHLTVDLHGPADLASLAGRIRACGIDAPIELLASGYLVGPDDHTSPPALRSVPRGGDTPVRFLIDGWTEGLRVGSWYPVDQGRLDLRAVLEIEDGAPVLIPIEWAT